jgi:hypothetical protein
MIRTPVASALLLASLAVSSACAKNSPANANAAPQASLGASEHQGMGPGMMGIMGMGGDQCPMVVPDTTAQASDMPDGAAMTFTTKGDVGELRKRVRAMAERMNGMSSSGSGMGMHGIMTGAADAGSGMTMGGGTPGMMMGSGGMGPGMMGRADAGSGMMMGTMMPAVRAHAEDVEGGARLQMVPVDPARLGDLKDHMSQHAAMMNQAHGCPMTGAGH